MQDGMTPLHSAKDGVVAKVLVDAKADVNAKDTVVMFVCECI